MKGGCFKSRCAGHLARFSALPVLTALMAAPLRFSKNTPADSAQRLLKQPLIFAVSLVALFAAVALPARADGVAHIGCQRLVLSLTPPVTPAIVDRDWETGASHNEAPATLTLYGCDGKPLDHITLAAPLARLDTTPLRDPYAVIFLTSADLTAPAGSTSGPLTLPVEVLHGHLIAVFATDAAGKSAPIQLAATGKSFWRTTPNGAADDILMVNCAPDWGNDRAHWNGKDFRVFYRRFHATPTGWQVRTRSAPGFWESDDDFPGITEFPGS
jgi:hypothetical protein